MPHFCHTQKIKISMDIQSLRIPTELCSLRSFLASDYLGGYSSQHVRLFLSLQLYIMIKREIDFWPILKCNMADASGKKNSCQLFSYPYSLCDTLLVFLGNHSILYLFMKPPSSLPSVSPSWWAGLLKGRDILVDSSSFLPSYHPPNYFIFHPTALSTPATDLIFSFVCFPDKITGQVL